MSSFGYQQGRSSSPTSVTGLLPFGSPESQHGGWAPNSQSFNRNFNQNQGSDYSLNAFPDTFELGYGGSQGNIGVAPHTPRHQLLKLLGESAIRWLVTVLLCGLYILTIFHYGAKDIMDETSKRKFNTWTVALSIAMGLNMASSFKEMALNLRWWLLSRSNRNLNEVDMILRCESLQSLGMLLLRVHTPLFVTFCVSWLLLNFVSQAAIAMISLTYGIEPDPNTALTYPGNVSISDMGAFYPFMNTPMNATLTDQSYIAHTYGITTLAYGFDDSGYSPPAGRTWASSNAVLWLTDQHTWTYTFLDSPASGFGSASIFTTRKINSTWSCEAHPIISGGNGTQTQFSIQNGELHNVTVAKPNSTIFYTNDWTNACADTKNGRCAVVQVFETSDTQPWYYKCDITISEVTNARADVPAQHVSDEMAWIAAGSIALEGYLTATPDNPTGPPQEAQLYPDNSFWGFPMEGNAEEMGKWIALFALGSIAVAAFSNPPAYYNGMEPVAGQQLNFSEPLYFYLIIGFLCGGQLALLVVISVMANEVTVRPDSHLAISDLLRPITKRMEVEAGPYEKRKWKRTGRDFQTKYIKDPVAGWKLKDV